MDLAAAFAIANVVVLTCFFSWAARSIRRDHLRHRAQLLQRRLERSDRGNGSRP